MRISCSGQPGLHCPAVQRYSCTCRLQCIWCVWCYRLEILSQIEKHEKTMIAWILVWANLSSFLCGGKTWNAATARSNMRSKSRPKKWRRLQASPATCIKRPPSLQSQYPTKQWVSSMQFVSKNQLAAWFWWFRGMIDRQTHTQMMKAPWELQLYCRFQELLTTTHVPLALSILYPLHSASNAGPSRA